MDGFYVGDIIGNSYTHEAEAYYKEIPSDILNKAIKFLPNEFLLLLKDYKISCKKKQ